MIFRAARPIRRYTILSGVGVNHISSYNRLGSAELSRRLGREVEDDESSMPHVVLVIDELADLMAVAQKEVEDSIHTMCTRVKTSPTNSPSS